MTSRPPAVAGSWYPATPGALAREVEGYAAAVPAGDWSRHRLDAIVAPHAGIMFSGPVAAHAYVAAAAHEYEVAVLVGPSHFARFDGVGLYPSGRFETPLGPIAIDEQSAAGIARFAVVQSLPRVHAREHSLEMQLPFIKRLLPRASILPLLMGEQDRNTIDLLAMALAEGVPAGRVLLVASTDLSHYFDAATAARLDGAVCDCVDRFDVDGLLRLFESYPSADRGRSVGCGMGAALAVMMAARMRGARAARVLKYAHSGEISGDYDGVVGYMAAAVGTFDAE
jgi:AmmeMemoRadiSam system protein B